MMIRKCTEKCNYFRTFEKREDEPSDCGCKYPNWEGYVRRDQVCFVGLEE